MMTKGLQDRALGLLGLGRLGTGAQDRAVADMVNHGMCDMQMADSPDSLVKDALEVALSEGRALEILVCSDFAGAHQSLLIGDGFHPLLPQRVERRSVLSEIELGAHQDDGDVGSVVVDLGVPLRRRTRQ